jgi:hypothetical protein
VPSLIERLRALPRPWVVIGGGTFTAIVVVVVVAASGGGGSEPLATSDPSTTTASPTMSSTGTTTTAPLVDTTTTARGTVPNTTGEGTTAPFDTIDVDATYRLDIDAEVPAVEGRVIPVEPPVDESPPVTIAPPAWAASTRVTEAGQLATDVGCADDTSAASLDLFFSRRVGPVLGWDYQHVYPLGGDRYLWLFQDTFLDHSGTKVTLGSSRFVHNAAMVQDGDCFTLLHRGAADQPAPFEIGDGTVNVRTKWLWPMGGELVDDRLSVFWAEMIKDPYDPDPPDGLGWHPSRLFLATYDSETLERLSWESPRNSGVEPIYGYAVSSDETHTYLFGNTFEQNLLREGGFWNGPHTATRMYLARVPLGKITEWPEYRTADGWSYSPADAVPIVERFYAENPMQPRYLDGQWVSATAVDGYWGDALAIDVATDPWGPWATVRYGALEPRNGDPKMNTYHAHPLPWRDAFGSVQITVSNNARNMQRDAWNTPARYRPMVIFVPYTPTPTTTTSTTTTTTPRPTSTTTTTLAPTTSTSTTGPPPSTSTTTTTLAPTTSTSTTGPPPSTSTTTTTLAPTTSTTTSTSTTSTSTTTTTSTTVASAAGDGDPAA